MSPTEGVRERGKGEREREKEKEDLFSTEKKETKGNKEDVVIRSRKGEGKIERKGACIHERGKEKEGAWGWRIEKGNRQWTHKREPHQGHSGLT